MLKFNALHAFGENGKDADKGTRISATGEDVVDVLPGPSLISVQGRRVDRVEKGTSVGSGVMEEVAKPNEW